MADNRKLHRPLETDAATTMTLADDTPALVDQREAAVEVVADDREKGFDPPALEYGVGEALVDGECALELLELFVGEVRHGGLGDRHEGHLVRHAHHRKADLVGLRDERGRRLGKAEAEPEAEARQAMLREATEVGPLRRGELPDPEAGREQELPALEELGGIFELRDVQPADVVVQTVRPGDDLEPETRHDCDVADGQQRRAFDEAAKTVRPGGVGIKALRGQVGGAGLARVSQEVEGRGRPGPRPASDSRGPCRPWRCRAR